MAQTPLVQDIQQLGALQGDFYTAFVNLQTCINELKTTLNGIRTQHYNRAFDAAGLAIGGTTTSYKHANTIAFAANGVHKRSASTADHAFTVADTITQNLWGGWIVSLTGTTWKTTAFGASPMAYATEAAAIAAMPAVPANEAMIGYITVQARSTATFTANTTNLTADNGSTNSQTVNYYDGGLDKISGTAAIANTFVLTKG